MPRIRGSATTRPRARLISTPGTTYPDHEGTSMSTTVEGVRFSDQLAALLDHAAAHGFRLERTKPLTITAYPPDGTTRPITVTERGAKFNRPHYENLRREFYRAGCPPLPGDTAHPNATDDTAPTPTAEETPAMPKKPHVKSLNTETDLRAELTGEDGPDTLAAIVAGLFERADISPFADLASNLVYVTAKYARENMNELATAALAAATSETQEQIDTALKLAADAEAKAERLQTQLDKAAEREAQARKDCGAALERAREAEAKAAELDAAISPLRALLGK